MNYNKKDALMTRGLAILSMLVLHLFCRQGADVLGTPIIWLNQDTPFVYWFGFFAEICVPLYSICAGYANELLLERNRASWKDRLRRIGRLMLNYWIIVVLFSILGLVFDKSGNMPGSWSNFLGSLVLIRSYNGAWWYLHTYVIMLLIPPRILLWPAEKLKLGSGMLFCLMVSCAWYVIGKASLLPDAAGLHPAVGYVLTEMENLAGILAYVWAGAVFCRNHGFERAGKWFEQHVEKRLRKWSLLLAAAAIFVGFNIIHKSVLTGITAMSVFILFNLWEKDSAAEQIFLFLGKHSTNIWLTHMFFYVYVFSGLVQRAKYPVFMLAFMLVLCVITSYIVQAIVKAVACLMPRRSLWR